jgi:hypothetical protein
MLFEPIESFEDSPIQFTVEALLEDSRFNDGLQNLENTVKSSSALEDKRIVIESYVSLNDIEARAKLASLYTEIDKTINLIVDSKINIESSSLNNTIATQNGIFTKNIERILRDANKESFLNKIGSVITAPVRALGASVSQIAKGALFSVGEAAISPIKDKVGKQFTPITSFVAERSGNAFDNASKFVQNRSGLTPDQAEKAFNYFGSKIDSIFDANKIYESIKDGIAYLGKLQYESKDEATVKDKLSKVGSTVKSDALDAVSKSYINTIFNPLKAIELKKEVDKLDSSFFLLNKSIISIVGILPTLSKEFFKFGAIKQVKEKTENLSYYSDPNKKSTIVVGGFFNEAGRGSTSTAVDTKSAFPNNNVYAFENKKYDPNPEAPNKFVSLFGRFLEKVGSKLDSSLQRSLSEATNLLGNAFIISPDDIELAANAIYLAQGSSGVEIQAFCGGGFTTKGAVDLINATAPDNKITATAYGVGLPGFTGTTAPNLRNVVSNLDPTSVSAKLMGSDAEIFEQSKNRGIAGQYHSSANYLNAGILGEKESEGNISTTSKYVRQLQGYSNRLLSVINNLESAKTAENLLSVDKAVSRKINNFGNILKEGTEYKDLLNDLAEGKELAASKKFLIQYVELVEKNIKLFNDKLISVKEFTSNVSANVYTETLSDPQNVEQLDLNSINARQAEIQNISKIQELASGKVSDYFFSVVKATALPQPKKNTFETQLSNALSANTTDNMQSNYIQSKVYNGNVQSTTPKVELSTPLNDLVNDFVKYGRYYSAKMWKDVYQIITSNAVNSGLDVLTVQQAFTNLNVAVNQTTNQTVKLWNGLKQLETLMVGSLADNYRKQLSFSVNESASLALGFGETQLKVLSANLYNSLSNGINNAVDNSEKYKGILGNSLDRLYVRVINDFQNLSAIEKSGFEKIPFKLAYIAKFLIQAGIVAQTPLALPGSSVGASIGAQASLPMSEALDGLGGMLGSVPLKGQALQAGVEVFRDWFVNAFVQLSSTVGQGAAAAAETVIALPIQQQVEDKVKQFANERQNLTALPGTSENFVKESIDTKDDFEQKLFNAKDSNEVINQLESFNVIPAKKLYKVAQKLGSGISSRSSKASVIQDIRGMEPDLEALQSAVSKVYAEVKGITNAERKDITNKYNTLISKVRKERETLINSSLPESEIIDGLKSLNNQLYKFKLAFNLSSGQVNSVLRLQEGIGKDINRFTEPVKSSVSEVLPSLAPASLESQFVQQKIKLDVDANNAEVKAEAQYTGRMFSKGIEEGINQGKKEALEDVLVLARSLIIVAQNALEIKSPSNVSDKKVGLPFVQGISRAIEKGKSLLKNSILDLASSFIVDSENAFKAKVNPEIYVTAKSLQNSDKDVINSNPIDNIVKDLDNQVINSRPDFEKAKADQDLVAALNKQVIKYFPKIEISDDPWEQATDSVLESYQKSHRLIQNSINQQLLIDVYKAEPVKDPFLGSYRIPKNNEDKIKENIVKNNIRSEQGFTRVDRPFTKPEKVVNKVPTDYSKKGLDQTIAVVETIENGYKKLTSSIKGAWETTRRFIDGNKTLKNSENYIKGVSKGWQEAKAKLGEYLGQFQLFGIQGSTFAKLGLGAVGIFALVKGLEALKYQMTEIIDISRQSSKVEQFFSDATSNPKANIDKISKFADKVGLDKLSLLQSSAEQTVGLKTVGYDEKKSLDVVEQLTKVSVGRRFSADESTRFFKPILQIASKDKFSQEEITQQLADIGIFGAPKLAAKATGFGNDTAKFLKATSQGEVTANLLGKDGLTNLERFTFLLSKVYGSDKELDPLVATTTRVNNNFKELQINVGKAITPLLQFGDPIVNTGLRVLGDNASTLTGVIKTIGVVSVALVIPALFKLASTSNLLSGAFKLVNQVGLQTAITSTIGASKIAKWALIATAAISSVSSFYNNYINNTNQATKALDELIKKEKERKNPTNTGNIFNDILENEGTQNRGKGVGNFFGSAGSIVGSIVSLDLPGVFENVKGNSTAIGDVIYGTDNFNNTFGKSGFSANKEQRLNRDERDKALEVKRLSENTVNESKSIAADLAAGKVVDPERLRKSQEEIGNLNSAFKSINPEVKANDKEIGVFSKSLEKLDDDLFNVSIAGRNLTQEMSKLKLQLEENKVVSLKIDLETEVNKAALPFNDVKISSLYDFSSEQKKLDEEIRLQEKLTGGANEKLNSADYQNLVNSTVEGQQEKAISIKSEALQQQQALLQLQIAKQKGVNNRRKELLTQEKEELEHIFSSRKLNNEIVQGERKNNKRVEIFNKTGNLDTVDAKYELAKSNSDSILDQMEQNSLSLADNEKLYYKNLITTREYQTNILQGRKEQVTLEGQFNDSLIELNNIEKEKASILVDLTQKQKEYDNKLKENSYAVAQIITDKYGEIRKELRKLDDEINSLTSDALTNLGSVIQDKIGQLKGIFSGDSSEVKGNDYALRSYLTTLERISGIRINKDRLATDTDGEYQARLIYNIEVAKVNIQIQALRLKKDGLSEELVIQRKILDIEQQKARFNADVEIDRANANLEKAQIKGDPNDIKIAQIEVNSAYRNRQFLDQSQGLENSAKTELDNLKIRSLDVEGAKLSIDLKKGLVENENLRPFGDTDPYKNISDFISKNLTAFETSVQYQKNSRPEVRYQAPLPALNVTNNFNGVKQNDIEYDKIGRKIGEETMNALKQYKSSVVNSVK